MRDAKSSVCGAILIPRNRLDVDGWSLNESLRFLGFLGYTSVVLKN